MTLDEKFVIKGLNGKKSLKGTIKTPGAKNAILKVLASVLLFKDEITVSNVPEIEDVNRMFELLTKLGVIITKIKKGTYRLRADKVISHQICPDISKHLRASTVLAGPLLARLGQVSFPYPGGCVIGKRPIDFFLDGFKSYGAVVKDLGDHYDIKLNTKSNSKTKTEIFFKNISVTATENFMMMASIRPGLTILKNSAMEPEIVSLGEFLNSCGANISGLGSPEIRITGQGLLSGKNKVYETMPDRIAAGSFIILGALVGEKITVTNCEPKHLDSLFNILKTMGVKMDIKKSAVTVYGALSKPIAVDIKTHEYPGFPTDLQAPLAVLLTQSVGQSFLFETIFEGRLNYLETLAQMEAEVKILDSHRAYISGPQALKAKEVHSPDLRAGLAYVLAGAVAEGTSVVHNVYYIDRGYERVDLLLQKLGLDIKRF